MSIAKTGLHNQGFNLIVVGILVERLGGKVTITQKDIDQVSLKRISEDLRNGVFTLEVYDAAERTKQ